MTRYARRSGRGTWGGPSDSVSGYYGTGYRYHAAGSGASRATWSVYVPAAGIWEVYVRYTSHDNRATDAPYRVSHSSGTSTVPVNQQTGGGQWRSLGEYTFNVGTASVRLTDDANGYVIADAVRLVYTGP